MTGQYHVSRFGVRLDCEMFGVVERICWRRFSFELSWLPSPRLEVVQFIEAAFELVSDDAPLPKRSLGGRSSDAVQAYAREGAEHGKRRGLSTPGNLAELSLSDPSRCASGVHICCVHRSSKLHDLWMHEV